MKTLRNTITAFLLAAGIHAFADDYAFLNVSQDSGETVFEVSQISKITFDTPLMTVHLTDGTVHQLPLAGLQKMSFTENGGQGISAAAANGGKIRVEGGRLHLQLGDGEQAYIYDMNGRQIYATNRSGTVHTDRFAKGVYIVRVGDAAKKVTAR